MSLLGRANRRYLLRHPWQLGLSIVGVALGVAVVVSIDVANGSALRAFDIASRTVTGDATHRIVGGPTGVDETVYRELRVAHGVRAIAPVVEETVTWAGGDGRALRLLGLDPFAERPFRSTLRGLGRDFDAAAFLARSGTAVVGAATASELGVEVGDTFVVEALGVERRLELVGLAEPGPTASPEAIADLVLVDVSTAQEILDRTGRLSRIDVRAPDGVERAAWLSRVERLLAPGLRLEAAGGGVETAEQMTRAFRLNLRSLSFLALLCGAFLIYNAMTFAVVRRRPLIGMVRALGATRREIFRGVLLEALAIGVAGSIVGLLAGAVLGRGLVDLVARTINDLYFTVSVRSAAIAPTTLWRGAMLGVAGTLAAALPPAWEATAVAPRAALARVELEAFVHRAIPRATAAGLVLAAVGAGLLWWTSEGLASALAGLFALLLGCALLTPLATRALMAVLTPVAGRWAGGLGRMATRGVTASLSRTAVAVAALMMAVSVTVGVDVMIKSFRHTVTRWLEYSLQSDLYITLETSLAERFVSAATFEPALVEELRSLPQVRRLDTLRHATLHVDGEPVRSVALDLGPGSRRAFGFRQGNPDEAWEALEAGRGVLVSEPLANRMDLAPGSTVELASPRGPRRLPVVAVFYDYASDQGLMMLGADLYRGLWDDPEVTAVGLRWAPGVDGDAARARVREVVAGTGASISTTSGLRESSLEVFDRTFAITGVLRLLAVTVAFVGVLSALTALQLERARELGVLRATGVTPGELRGLVLGQTGLLGLCAGLLAVPVGLATAAAMIYVVNLRSFGWTLQMRLEWVSLAQAPALAIVAALIAGAYPAWRMAAMSPAEALREE